MGAAATEAPRLEPQEAGLSPCSAVGSVQATTAEPGPARAMKDPRHGAPPAPRAVSAWGCSGRPLPSPLSSPSPWGQPWATAPPGRPVTAESRAGLAAQGRVCGS